MESKYDSAFSKPVIQQYKANLSNRTIAAIYG
jgi:hypothetical protein